MKTSNIAFLLILASLTALAPAQKPEKHPPSDPENTLEGEWVRMSPVGPISLLFKSDGTVEGDFGRDNSVDIVSAYSIEYGTITFRDKEGISCPGKGMYKVDRTDYYLAFDLIEDNCGGRLKATMGFWVRPDFEDRMKPLTERISASAEPEDYINRARMYMALGKSAEAKEDLDQYIKYESSDFRAFVNRAGTRFPGDLKGVVEDCNQALDIDPEYKNAYFLKGLALYQLGEHEKACLDFHKAIELGFTILKEAEHEKCSDFWKSYVTE